MIPTTITWFQSNSRRRFGLPMKVFRIILMVLFSSALSIFLFVILNKVEKKSANISFDQDSRHLFLAIEKEIEANLEVVKSLQALYNSSHIVDRAEFREFTKQFLNDRQSIQALEWVPRVLQNERIEFEKKAKQEGLAAFHIIERKIPGLLQKGIKRKAYFPVYYVEPIENNESALGYDIGSYSQSFEALSKACDSGHLIASNPMKLVQDKLERLGILALGPIYHPKPENTVASRRKNMSGFVVGVFRINSLFDQVLKNFKPKGTSVYLFEQTTGLESQLIYSSLSEQTENSKNYISASLLPSALIQKRHHINVANRKWLLLHQTTATYFVGKYSWYPLGISIGLFLFSNLLGLYVWSLGEVASKTKRTNQDLLNEIAERGKVEKALIESRRLLEGVIEHSPAAIYVKDSEGRYILANSQAAKIFPDKLVLGKSDIDMFFSPNAATFHRRDQEILKTGEALQTEENLTIEGKETTHTIVRFPILDAEDHPYAIAGIATDITENKNRQKYAKKLNMVLLGLSGNQKLAEADFNDSLEEITKAAAIALEVQRVSVWFFDKKRTKIKCAKLFELDKNEFSKGAELGAEAYPSYFNALERQLCIVVNDVHSDQVTQEFSPNYLTRYGISSILDVPIQVRGKMIGVVRHEHVGLNKIWKEKEQGFAISIADYVTKALVLNERKQTEAALQESEEKFRILAETAPIPFVITRLSDGLFLYFNNQFTKVFGYSKKVIDASKASEFYFDPDDHSKLVKDFFENGLLSNYEVKAKKSSGEPVWVKLYMKKIRYQGEQVLFTVLEDITARRYMEYALRESRQRFQTLSKISPVGIFENDVKGNCIYVNDKLLKIIGLPPKEAYGTGWVKTVHEEDRQMVVKEWTKMVREKIPFKAEYRLVHSKGTITWVLGQAEAKEKDGKISGFVGTVTDITKQNIAAKERENLIGKLESKNAELEQFAYTVSHDLKSPLITFKGFLAILEKDITDQNSQGIASDFEYLYSASDRMSILLEELLELSRVGRVGNTLKELYLEELYHEVLNLLGRQTKEIKINLANGKLLLYGDRSRLIQILQNLLDNAIKFMGEQTDPKIEVGGQLRDGQVLCYVKDNGIGINPRYHKKIFDLFDRLDQQIEGSGIGLSMVKRIISAHGGEIWVESEGLGCGSCFYFLLPSKQVN